MLKEGPLPRGPTDPCLAGSPATLKGLKGLKGVKGVKGLISLYIYIYMIYRDI